MALTTFLIEVYNFKYTTFIEDVKRMTMTPELRRD